MSIDARIPDYLKKEEYQDTKTEFHPNGVLSKEIITVTEKLIKEIFYDENGLIQKIIDYDDLGNVLNELEMGRETSKSGLSFTYYPNGNVQSLKYFINGKVNWVEKVFNTDGQLKEVISYKKGIKSGTHTIFSDRNAKLSEVTYDNNLPTGKAKYFYETGELKAEMIFSEGKKHGVLKYFHKNGNLRKKESIIDGVRQGYTTFYFENGAIKERWNYNNGQLNDESLKYDMHGKIIKKVFYSEGEVISGPAAEAKDDLDRLLYAEKTQKTEKIALAAKEELKPLPDKLHEQKKSKVVPVEVKAKSKVKLAISYTGIFIGILLLIYILYSLIIYFS